MGKSCTQPLTHTHTKTCTCAKMNSLSFSLLVIEPVLFLVILGLGNGTKVEFAH